MTQWYYLQNGQQTGPVDQSSLSLMIAGGQLGPSDMVWREGMAQWQPVSAVPELGGPAAGPAAPAAYDPQAPYGQTPYPQSYPQPQYGQPNAGPLGYAYPSYGQKRRSGAVTTVGVISIIWGGLFVLCTGVAGLALLAIPSDRLARLSDIQKAIPFISFVLHACLVASGVGTLMLKKWAGTLVWIITGPIVVMYIYNLTTAFQSTSQLPAETMAARNVGRIIGGILGIGWPLFLCIFYQQPNVKQQFEAASQAR